MTILIIFMLLCRILPAPGFMAESIPRPEPINPYEHITNAVTRVESENGRFVLNEKENAVGWFGIRPIRLKDYNQKTGKSITLDSCYDYEVSKMIFLYYATRYEPDQYRLIARDWNGSRTDKYWNRVKAFI